MSVMVELPSQFITMGHTTTRSEVLDCIVHAAALDDIVDLQNNVCGCGIEHRFNAKDHIAKLIRSPSEASEVN